MSESDRHDHGTPWTWARAWITACTVLVVAWSTLTVALDEQWIGTCLGLLLALELIGAAKRLFSRAMHADEIESRADEIIASQTGTWRLFVQGEAPARFTVRWDAWERQYVTESRTEDGFNMTWPDSVTLQGIIEGQERAGWVPNDDEPTRGIRGRLDLAPFKREDTL